MGREREEAPGPPKPSDDGERKAAREGDAGRPNDETELPPPDSYPPLVEYDD